MLYRRDRGTSRSARQEKAYQQRIEEIARAAYDRCHPEDSFDDLKYRASFSKEDRMLLRDWLAAARAQLGAGKHR